MTLNRVLFNGTNGVDMTTGNSGATLISGPAAGQDTAQFTTADGVNGTGATFTNTTGGATTNVGRWNFSAANKQGAISLVFRTPSSTAQQVILASFRQASGRVWQLKWDTTSPGGRLLLIGSSNENNYLLGGSQTVGLATSTKYRLEAQFNNNSSAAGGTATFNAQLYDMSDTLLYSYNALPSGDGTAIGTMELGAVIPSAAATSVGFDNLQMNDGATSAIGKYSPNSTPPVVTPGADQTLSPTGQTVTLSASAVGQNGDTVVSYSWTNLDYPGSAPTISGSSTATPTFTLAAGVQGRYRFNVTATDSSGNTSAPVVVRVFATGTAIFPIEVVSNSGTTLSGISALTDTNDATYAELSAGSTLVLRLAPLVANPTGFTLDVRNYVTAVAGTQSVALLDSDGTTVRKDWGAISPGTSASDQFLSMTSGELSAGGSWDWKALCLRFIGA